METWSSGTGNVSVVNEPRVVEPRAHCCRCFQFDKAFSESIIDSLEFEYEETGVDWWCIKCVLNYHMC